MKNRSSKNEENHHVTSSEKYKDVENWFVRLSRTVSVSIVSYFLNIGVKNAFLKNKIHGQKVNLGYARCCCVFYQNLGNLLSFTLSKNRNVQPLRHSWKINKPKQNQNSSNFSKRSTKKAFNLKMGSNGSTSIKIRKIYHGKKSR